MLDRNPLPGYSQSYHNLRKVRTLVFGVTVFFEIRLMIRFKVSRGCIEKQKIDFQIQKIGHSPVDLFLKGLLMFAPVGVAGECVKIAPPLITPLDALQDGLATLDEACDAVLG